MFLIETRDAASVCVNCKALIVERRMRYVFLFLFIFTNCSAINRWNAELEQLKQLREEGCSSEDDKLLLEKKLYGNQSVWFCCSDATYNDCVVFYR